MSYHFNLASLFTQIVNTYSEHAAIKYAEQSYSYQRLNTDSALVATFLLQEGITRGDVIAIINSKQYISFVLMLACIKIGAIYTNIDPDAPLAWFNHIVHIAKPTRIFSDAGSIENSAVLIESTDVLIHFIENNNNPLWDYPHFDGDAVAYIMFTSGSTGMPKGVAITQQNLLHFIHWSVQRYSICPGDIFANVSPLYFDNSVFDFYTALFSGACIAPIAKAIVSSPKQLVEYVDLLKCTIWFSVPSLLIYLMTTKVLQQNTFSYLRVVTFGGEGYPKIELKKLFDLYNSRIKFINVYGPTECTCICSSYTITEKDFENLDSLPALGEINPNISYLILNSDNKLDVMGELCLFGPNVAVGYYNDFERSASVFYHYTGYGFYQTKMYRTGDLVRQAENLLYFVGRKDNQIKHMGYRIELEAIEIAINKLAGVNEAAVVYVRNNVAYGKIIAFIATENSNLDSNVIKVQLKKVLPEYMLPNQCEFLECLPKNANGKIDRVKLKNGVSQIS